MLTMPVAGTRLFAYPRLFGLHDIEEDVGRVPPGGEGARASGTASDAPVKLPPQLNLSAERLTSEGVYVMDDGVEIIVWVGRGAPGGLLHALFGVGTLDGVDTGALQLVDLGNDYSGRVCAIIATLREPHAQAQRLRIVREGSGDAGEARFHWHLVEDRQPFTGGSVTYAEYLQVVFRESQMTEIGGTVTGGSG